jgi:hypothetical protein
MKAILTLLFLLGFVFSGVAQIETNATARLKTKVVCYEGKIKGGSFTTAVNPSPENTSPGSENKDTGTSPGHEYELDWKFIGRTGNKDLYHFTFTRMTKAGISDKTSTSKEVSFDGKRVTVFEDDLHTVILESPGAEDLKTAK